MEQLQHLVLSLVDHYGYVGVFLAMTAGNVGAPVGAEVLMPLVGGLVGTGHLPQSLARYRRSRCGRAGGQLDRLRDRTFRRSSVLRINTASTCTSSTSSSRASTDSSSDAGRSRFLSAASSSAATWGSQREMAQMSLAPFYLWTFLGSLVFCGGFVAIGYALGDHLNDILPLIHKGGLALLAIAVVVAVAAFFVMRARTSAQRAG